MSAQPIDPTCDICGTTKQHAPGIGLYCPNNKCGEEAQNTGTVTVAAIANDAPPANGRFVQLSSASVQSVLGEKLRKEQPMLEGVKTVDLFGVMTDGSKRKLTDLMVQVRYPAANKRPGPHRIVFSQKHPKGVVLRLATRDGVTL